MKLELLKKHLEEVVGIVSRVSNKNLSLPVLGCVVISAKKNHTTIQATNLDVSVEVQLKSKIISEGRVAVPAQIFSQAVAASTDEKLVLGEEEGALTITTKHGEVKLNTVDPSDFPTLPFVKEGVGVTLTLPSREFIRSLKGVAFAAAASGMRPELSSVFISIAGGVLTTAATDSFRLAEMQTQLKTKHTIDPVLIPARNIQDIIRVIGNSETTEVRIDENQITYISEGNYITSRVIDGAFPEYRAILPKDFTMAATVLTEDAVKALRNVSVVADQAGQVEFSLSEKDKSFSVRGVNTHVGETYEKLDAALEGDDVSMNFNIRYILDALGVVSTDSVVFKFSGPGKPLIIKEIPEKGFTYLVMPMNT